MKAGGLQTRNLARPLTKLLVTIVAPLTAIAGNALAQTAHEYAEIHVSHAWLYVHGMNPVVVGKVWRYTLRHSPRGGACSSVVATGPAGEGSSRN
jgi:hypothetical protein